MPNFTPTEEQTAIVNAALTGENVVVEAGAGSGKTSTLKLIAEALSGKAIYYGAFNKAIAQEQQGGKMPSNVDPQTWHKIARDAIVRKTRFEKKIAKLTSLACAQALGENVPLTYRLVRDGQEHEAQVKPSTIGYLATKTVERFCQSDKQSIEAWMCPHVDALDDVSNKSLAEYILPLANRIWADVTDPHGFTFAFSFPHYLKMYQLADRPLTIETGGQWTNGRYGLWRKGGNRTKADVILYDEAQDASPVTQAIVAQNVARGVQVIVVGDRAQAIYGFTGARNAMGAFEAPHHLKLTKSFRFGNAIAELANQFLAKMPDTDMQIVGHDSIPSTVAGIESKD